MRRLYETCPECGQAAMDFKGEIKICGNCRKTYVNNNDSYDDTQIMRALGIEVGNNNASLTQEILLQCALENIADGRPSHFNALFCLLEITKRFEVEPLVKNLRSTLECDYFFFCHYYLCPERYFDDLVRMVRTYQESCEIWLAQSDATISPDTATQVFDYINLCVSTLVSHFTLDAVGYGLTNAGSTFDLWDPSKHLWSRKFFFQGVDLCLDVLEWGKVKGRMLSVEDDNKAELLTGQGNLGRRSTWVRLAMVLLLRLSMCYQDDFMPPVEEVQKIYDAADVMRALEGVLNFEELHIFRMSPGLLPISQGGKGVHIHRFRKLVDGEERYRSVCEWEYYRVQHLRKISIPNSGDSVLIGTGAVAVIAIALAVLIALDISCHVCAIGAVISALIAIICVYLSLKDWSPDKAKVENELYHEWLQSPVHGTTKPNYSLAEFLEWLDTGRING